MKNVIFWVGVKNQTYSEKYGGWEWMDISKRLGSIGVKNTM